MRNTKWLRLVALLSVLALVLAACGDGDDAGDEGSEPADETTTQPDETPTTAAPEDEMSEEESGDVGGDGILTIGTLLPVTGDLAFLGPA